MPFLSQQNDGSVFLQIHVQPQASKSKIVGVYDSRLKIAVTAPPVDGKANSAIVKFLSKFLRVPKRNIMIISGGQSKRKKIVIQSLQMEDARSRIEKVL